MAHHAARRLRAGHRRPEDRHRRVPAARTRAAAARWRRGAPRDKQRRRRGACAIAQGVLLPAAARQARPADERERALRARSRVAPQFVV